MVLVAVTVVGAALVGWLRGGSLRHLGRTPLRGAALAGGAAAAQLLAAATSGAPARILTALSLAAVLALVWLNRLRAGAALIAAGAALNAAVIVANGAMPVSRSAIQAVAQRPAEVAGRHRLLESTDALPWLADIIPLPLLRTVISVGDVFLAAGVGLLVMQLMHPPPGRRAGSTPQPRDGLGQAVT